MFGRNQSVPQTFQVPAAPPAADTATRSNMGAASAISTLRRVVILLSLAAVASVVVLPGGVQAGLKPVPPVSHVVLPGENLWIIAQRLTEPGSDVRNTVRQLKDLNGMDSSMIYAGKEILLPADP